MKLAIPMVLSAVVVVLAVSAVAQIGSASGPYRRTVNRGYAALAEPLVAASNASDEQLVTFLHDGSSLGRIAFFFTLDTLVADTADLARRYHAIIPPDPGTTTGCAAAITGRASAVSALRAALEGVVGGRTGLGRVNEGAAATALVNAGASLRSADASWAVRRRALWRAPGSAQLPASVWVRHPRVFGATAVARFVTQVAGSRSLAPVHSLALVDIVTDPPAVAGAQMLVAPATTTLVAHVVVANQGNVDEHGVELGGVATAQGTTAKPVLVQRTVDLAAARSTTTVLPGFPVQPGSSYTVEVVAESPRATGTGILVTRSIQIQVQPAATLTSVTSAPPRRGAGSPRHLHRRPHVLPDGAEGAHRDRGLLRRWCDRPRLRSPACPQGAGHVHDDLSGGVAPRHHRRVLGRLALRGVHVTGDHSPGGHVAAWAGPSRA